MAAHARITHVGYASTQALRRATFAGDDSLDEAGSTNVARLRQFWAARSLLERPALWAPETVAVMGLARAWTRLGVPSR